MIAIEKKLTVGQEESVEEALRNIQEYLDVISQQINKAVLDLSDRVQALEEAQNE